MTSSQKHSDSAAFLIGEWKTIDISVPEHAEQLHPEVLQTLKVDFSKSTFLFRADGSGVVNIVSQANTLQDDPSFGMEWEYEASTGVVTAASRKGDETWTEAFEIEQDGMHIRLTIDGEPPLTFVLEKFNG